MKFVAGGSIYSLCMVLLPGALSVWFEFLSKLFLISFRKAPLEFVVSIKQRQGRYNKMKQQTAYQRFKPLPALISHHTSVPLPVKTV